MGDIGAIDISAPFFFYVLRPWKKGTLATMDGRARFAEISFVGKSGIRIKSLVNFPMERIDNNVLVTAPEAGIIVTQSGTQKHIADISTGKTKSFSPLRTWRFSEGIPSIFDLINGIIYFTYYSHGRDENIPSYNSYNIIYDPKNDRILYQSPEMGETINFLFPFTPKYTMTVKRESNTTREIFFYNWRTREIIKNKLTEIFTSLNLMASFGFDCNINLAGRFLFANIGRLSERKKLKLTWDENYENVVVVPLDYLVSEGKRLNNDVTLSVDGKWATTFVSGYRGLYGEILVKRAFFHMDSRYPNRISIPVFVDNYDEYRYEIGSFVDHPVHGMCFAEEKYKNDKLYLRLYKMSDVLDEINRQLLEKAREVMSCPR